MKKEKREKSLDSEKNYKLAKIGIIIVAIIIIVIAYKIFDTVVKNNETVDLSGENYYQYFIGIREDYSGDIEIVRTDQYTQLIKEDGQVVYLDSTPIYYTDKLGQVIFPSKMELVNTQSGTLNALNNFTNLIQESQVMYVKKHNKDNRRSISNNSFLYDGADLYFFLEDMTITVGSEKYELSPLSYAIVNYGQNIEFYDYEKDEYTILDEKIATSTEILATNKNKDYTINMGVDSFSTASLDQLLIKNVNNLTELDY